MMKIFRSEFVQNYKTYSFGYSIYAIKENIDNLYEIYEKGFLPYSGKPKLKNHLYMARSIRIDLKKFKPNSENRRVLKKFENKFKREVIPIQKFDVKDRLFLSFCRRYFKEWHKIDIRGKLETILNSNFITDIVIYTDNKKIIGYVFLIQDNKMSHYWFSFYDLSLIRKSFGMWMMINEALEAKRTKKLYFYIGTGYGNGATYKTNFDFIEYWNGSSWVSDKKKLKLRAKTDDSRTVHFSDEWKD